MSGGIAVAERPVAEPEAAPPPRVPRRRRGWFLPLYTGLVIAYLFLPIGVMILFGFNDLQGPRGFNVTWQGFTLRHYSNVLDFPDLTSALKNSLLIAGASTLVATSLGTMIALALTRHRFRGRGGTNMFIFLPMATPEVVLGASLLSLFVSFSVDRGFPTILIAHIMFNISYVVVTVKARTQGFNAEWEEAAKDLGATPWTAFWTVTFPLIFPGILAAAVLAFALSVDDYVITLFNAGQTLTFPLWVAGASRFGVPPEVNVMGTILFVTGVLLALGSVFVQRGRYRDAAREIRTPVAGTGFAG
jgi:spermidine/putrescine transport system permease protein